MSMYGIGNSGTDLKDMFTSIFNASNKSSSSLLSDYASIRNGSYKKLMKAYYEKKEADKTESSDKSSYYGSYSSIKSGLGNAGVSEAKSAAQNIQDSLVNLMDRSDNVFKKDSEGNYNVDKIYEAVNSFVKGYNEMLDVSDTLNDERTLNKILNMARYTSSNRSALSYAGISFNEDGEMELDKDKFSKMDMNAVKNLFQGTGSYASQMVTKASNIQAAATVSLNSSSGIYGSSGSYENYFNTGTYYKGLF